MARHGNPDADHALVFVETVADPEGLYAPQPPEPPIGRVVEINSNGIKRQVRSPIEVISNVKLSALPSPAAASGTTPR
jgi:hypothetical protein